MPGTLGLLTHAEAVRAAFLAAVVAVPLAAFGPPGGDMPAHLYRTMLVEDGVLVWDNLWYGGHYPLASYSLLYYLPATVFGNLPLAVAAVILSAALFASVCRQEWGARAAWPARVFAVLASGSIFTGTYTYALGLAALLGAIRALQALGASHDVALVSFDEVPMGDALAPAVTVIAQDPVASGRRAAELLFSRVDGFAGVSRTVVLPTRLIERGSGEIPAPAAQGAA
mgnify:CR=1 FL=1